METVTDFIFLSFKIPANGDCSREIKTLAPWKKNYDKLSTLKIRNITLPTNVCIVKAIVFPVVVYRCESWKVKNVDPWWIDDFELWFIRRLLRVPWTARTLNPVHLKGNQHWIFIGRTVAVTELPILWSPSELMLKVKLQYSGHPMWRANLSTLMRGRLKPKGDGVSKRWYG